MRATTLAHTGMVPTGDENRNLRKCPPESQQNALTPHQPARQDPSVTQSPLSTGLPLIRETLNSRSISTAAKDIIMASWRTGTSKQYQVYLARWEQFCRLKGLNQMNASVENGIDYLPTV